MHPELFGEIPHADLPPEAISALRAGDAVNLYALIQLADGFARIFRPQGSSTGKAAVVDSARMLGAAFPNVARRYVAAAAGLRGDVAVPQDLRSDPSAVATCKRKLAASFLERLPELESYLQKAASA